VKLSVSDQNDLRLRRYQLGKLLQKVGLQLCPSGASLPLDAPQNGQGPAATSQRRDQQAPSAAQLQAVDQKAQRAALRRFLNKTPRDGAVALAWIDLLIVYKSEAGMLIFPHKRGTFPEALGNLRGRSDGRQES
jgi:hypothetical protein